jgi:hypothetical protein
MPVLQRSGRTFKALVAAFRRAIPGLTERIVPSWASRTKGNLGPANAQAPVIFTFADLEQAISPPRANRYLQSAIDPSTGLPDPAAALALYEYNSALSAATWATIADVEVVLRNAVADAIAGHHSTIRANPTHRWYDDPPWFTTGKWFTTETAKSIRLAMKRVKDPGPGAGARPGEGRVLAELTLGFWRYLLVPRYEHSLWNPAIRSRFPALGHLSGSDSRKTVHDRVEKLNYLRNRVAHHEPIYEPFAIPGHATPVEATLIVVDAIELISWSNPTAAAWITARSTVAAVAAAGP